MFLGINFLGFVAGTGLQLYLQFEDESFMLLFGHKFSPRSVAISASISQTALLLKQAVSRVIYCEELPSVTIHPHKKWDDEQIIHARTNTEYRL